MSANVFLDTNILVYAVTSDDRDQAKRQRALEIIEAEDFAISVQVLQEFYVTVTRKLAEPLTPEHALAWIEELEAFPCVSIETSLVKNAIEISVRYQTSYWDGAVLAAAESISVPRLYTEDLNHGQLYGSVEAFNPFL
ncbi:MAG: PIN domain-containing protein [Xanthomonadales bacterium]|nr:PIN domain-containing protein [Xanthomonadales bacterium]